MDIRFFNMCLKLLITLVILAIFEANCAVLLWSKQNLEVSPLKKFTDDDLKQLIDELGKPKVFIYRTENPVLIRSLQNWLDGYHFAYNPNGDIDTDAAEVLNVDVPFISERYLDKGEGTLSVLHIHERFFRKKREQEIPEEEMTTEEEPAINTTTLTETTEKTTQKTIVSPKKIQTKSDYTPPKGPVLYRGKSVGIGKNTYGLMYSSKALLLSSSKFSDLYLGETSDDLVKVDSTDKDLFTRLNIQIPLEDGNKLTLRFIFTWSLGYWTLAQVKITDNHDKYISDLNISKNVTAPARFSYHCSGETVFSNGDTKLTIYNMQVQIDSTNQKFSDAYDCVNFTSGPILSGLFVTALLGVGLIIALVAIGDIKTMDKFDNHKTRQLSITVSE